MIIQLTQSNSADQESTILTKSTEKDNATLLQLRHAACVVLQEIRSKIQGVTGGLTCSAGIANNFLLAKICADVNKPDGQFELQPTRKGEGDTVFLKKEQWITWFGLFCHDFL